jgi:RNA polymerase sigma-70 factor, ECF subfamily
MKKEEQELIRKAQKGDRDAFREIFDRYHGRLFSCAFSILMNKEDAEDVVQDAFVKVFFSIEGFKGDSSFYTWVYRIVHNLAVDLKRKKGRRGGDAEEYREDIGLSPVEAFMSPSSSLHHRQQLVLLQKALQELSDEHRETLVLREIEGLSYEEIADVTGVSKGTVMSRLFYARKKLQKSLCNVDELVALMIKNSV